MRKILLLASISIASFFNAQYSEFLTTEKFDYAVGQFGPEIPAGATTTTAQGGWLTWVSAGSTNGGASSFQVVDNGSVQGKALSVLGSNANTGQKKIINRDLKNAWANRNDGEFFQVETKIFVTGNSGSENYAEFYVWDSSNTSILAGISVSDKTGEIKFTLYSDAEAVTGGTGTPDIANWTWTFGDADKVFVPKNKWVTIGANWDSSSGEVIFLWDFNDGEGTDGVALPGAAAGLDVADLYVGTGPRLSDTELNTVGSKILYDDIFTFSTDDVYDLGELETLAVSDVTKTKASVSVYPNPTSDFLKFESKSKIDAVKVFDMAGKAVNVQVLNNQVDVRSLVKGIYVVQIQTAEGTSTQKFIKK